MGEEPKFPTTDKGTRVASVTAKVSQREREAFAELANAKGLSVSDLARECVLSELRRTGRARTVADLGLQVKHVELLLQALIRATRDCFSGLNKAGTEEAFSSAMKRYKEELNTCLMEG